MATLFHSALRVRQFFVEFLPQPPSAELMKMVGDLCAGDPSGDLAASWILLPDGAADRFHGSYQPAPDAATLRRARGWAVLRALGGILIGDAGIHGRPGGKPTWGPPAHAALRREAIGERLRSRIENQLLDD